MLKPMAAGVDYMRTNCRQRGADDAAIKLRRPARVLRHLGVIPQLPQAPSTPQRCPYGPCHAVRPACGGLCHGPGEQDRALMTMPLPAKSAAVSGLKTLWKG